MLSKFSWNGISSITDHVEFLAQSFKPTISGNLTKVSFYLPSGTQWLDGGLTAQLKTSLGGDRNTHLAQSTSFAIYGYATGAAWVA
jgi:hypothetical protein